MTSHSTQCKHVHLIVLNAALKFRLCFISLFVPRRCRCHDLKRCWNRIVALLIRTCSWDWCRGIPVIHGKNGIIMRLQQCACRMQTAVVRQLPSGHDISAPPTVSVDETGRKWSVADWQAHLC